MTTSIKRAGIGVRRCLAVLTGSSRRWAGRCAGWVRSATRSLQRSACASPREIVVMREGARMSQAVLARLLDVSTGTLSKWERGQLRPRGPAGRLLRIIKRKGIEAVL